MKSQIVISIKILMVLTVLTGIIYPLLITGISQLAFPGKANGSFIDTNEVKIGSLLIGQQFEGNKYFQGRPSAIGYNPLPSGGSNLAMSSKTLKERSEKLKLEFIIRNKLPAGTQVPIEMIYSSASGLDPHISVEAAKLQVNRISKATNIDKNQILQLISRLKESRQFYILGEDRINVLLLNIELDKIKK